MFRKFFLKKQYKKVDEIFDNNSFNQNLYQGLLKAFYTLLEDIKEGELYSFGIFTSGEYSYAGITANTYSGLDKVIKEYKDNSSYTNVSVDDLKHELKWSPCDWVYNCEINNEELDEVDQKLQKLDELSNLIIDKHNDFDSALEIVDNKIIQRLNKLYCDCLNKLKAEHSEVSRDITFGIWLGDQSEEDRVRFISQINSKELANKYITESRLGIETYESRQ